MMTSKRTNRRVVPAARKWAAGAVVLILVAGGIAGWLVYKTRHWQGQERFTVIETENGMAVESFDPQTGKGIRMKLPGNLEINGIEGKGEWMAEVMPKLGSKYGWKWVGESTADFLGIGYTAVDREMGWWDKWEWWRNSAHIDWQDVTLEGSAWVEEAQSADGVKFLRLSGLWPDKAREWFMSLGIADEGIGVTVVNATEIEGLGTHAARVIDSSGMHVTMVENDPGKAQGCVITADNNLKQSLSLEYLQREFGCQVVIGSQDSGGQITVRLGQKYGKWWLGPGAN